MLLFSKACRLVVGEHTCLGIFSKCYRLFVGGYTCLESFSVSPVRCSGTNVRLHRVIIVLPASGSRTYGPLSIFKEMSAHGRRTYPPRNIFKDMHARDRRKYRPYGPGIPGCIHCCSNRDDFVLP